MRPYVFIMGVVLSMMGIFVHYLDKALAHKQERLREHGLHSVNLYWPIHGPRPMMGVTMFAAGVILIVLYLFWHLL